MYSPWYLDARVREPDRRAAPRTSCLEVFPEARGGLELVNVDWVSGRGVLSMLVCVFCKLPAAVEVDLGTGGM